MLYIVVGIWFVCFVTFMLYVPYEFRCYECPKCKSSLTVHHLAGLSVMESGWFHCFKCGNSDMTGAKRR